MSQTGFRTTLLARAAAVGVEVAAEHVQSLQIYYELLERWNHRINLTALPLTGWPDATLDRLLLEPFVALPFLSGITGRWVDLGSGGGSPAIPLAVASRGLELTMTESRGKKAAFLREAIRAIPLPYANVSGRFEDLGTWPSGSVNVITSRAVQLGTALELASHLLSEVGCLLAFDSGPVKSLGGMQLIAAVPLPGNGGVLSILTRPRGVPRGTMR